MTGATHLMTKTELSANAGADLYLSDAYDPSGYRDLLFQTDTIWRMQADPTKLRKFAARYTDAWCSQDAASVAGFYSPELARHQQWHSGGGAERNH